MSYERGIPLRLSNEAEQVHSFVLASVKLSECQMHELNNDRTITAFTMHIRTWFL